MLSEANNLPVTLLGINISVMNVTKRVKHDNNCNILNKQTSFKVSGYTWECLVTPSMVQLSVRGTFSGCLQLCSDRTEVPLSCLSEYYSHSGKFSPEAIYSAHHPCRKVIVLHNNELKLNQPCNQI